MGKLDHLFSDAMNHLERVSNNDIPPCDVMTGFKELDEKLCGFDNGDFIVVGARPGVGKTSFLISCALNNARAGVPVLFYSFDLTPLQLVNRMISIVAKTSLAEIRRGLSKDQAQDLMTRCRGLESLPIFIEADAPRYIEEVCEHIEKTVKETGARIVYIDYLQFLVCKNTKTVDNRYQEVSVFSRSLKALARKLNIPIVATSELNRRPELRQEDSRLYKLPNMYDLRDSGTICEDANLVLLLSRPELYYKGDEDEMGRNIQGLVHVIVAKHNNGPTMNIELHYDNDTGAFNDPEPPDRDNYGGFYGGSNGYTFDDDLPDIKPF